MADERVSKAEFARRLGVTRQTVQAALKRGRLSPAAWDPIAKRVTLPLGLTEWHRGADPVRVAAHAEVVGRDPDLLDLPGAPSEFQASRTRKALIDEERAQIELDQLKGRYLKRSEVEDAFMTLGRGLGRELDLITDLGSGPIKLLEAVLVG